MEHLIALESKVKKLERRIEQLEEDNQARIDRLEKLIEILAANINNLSHEFSLHTENKFFTFKE